ncbi:MULTISPECIES: SphA family protein [Pseudomonas fluorescens group]|uniref:Transporter n=1 Tax=Pseudomonas petroselini TaxID=2899822 RepID=A0ABS8R1L8_9PSED|nr:transporter [Pseudomonas petroselini]MCD7044049.1 transporter [Pseudomonas petroselini]MCD7067254.1 transporter [Pseudomonas petroselini]MCD7080437.1 transporter [Pseudomonas petroselini]MCM2380871.1 transporter [Pseudomonas marginalis]
MSKYINNDYLVVASSLLLLCSSAQATEAGAVHYPIGANTIMNAVLPMPGNTALYLYVQNYHSNRLNDTKGNSIDKNFSLDVQAVAPRFLHTWEQKLGPFFMTTVVVTPMINIDVNLFGRHEKNAGFGDPSIAPIYLYYVSPGSDFFAYTGVDFYVPVGEYDEDSIANPGLNYWSASPSVNFTWLPSPRVDMSATLYAEFNAKNKATGYRSGNTATLDFGMSYRPFLSVPQVRVALQGSAFKQFTDDEQDGSDLPGGNRGQVFSFGPQVSYDLGGGAAILLKYQQEFKAENRPEGNKVWMQAVVPL